MNKSIKNRALHRVKIIEGQTRGLAKMISKEEYCTHIIHQSLAIKKAINSLERLILENHLKTHVTEDMKKGHAAHSIKEIVELFDMSQRR